MQLKLYNYWRSSCSWRVRWAFAIKGVAYENIPVNILTGEHRAPEYLAKNPSGFLPALELDGAFYGESLALVEWIDETWPEPALMPKDQLGRLRVRQLALTIVAGTQPLQNPSLLKHFVPEEAARKPHAQHFIASGLKTYETLLASSKPGRFSHGDAVTIADLCLVPQVYNAQRFDVDLTAMPRIRAIYEACLKTTACDAAHPARQPGAQ